MSLTRRLWLKFLALGSIGSCFAGGQRKVAADETALTEEQVPTMRVDRWNQIPDRVWLGEEFWANPMENWHVANGEAECLSPLPGRNIQLLTHQLRDPQSRFRMQIRVRRVAGNGEQGGAGFRLGIRSDVDDFRANCFQQGGILAGVSAGKLILGGKTKALPVKLPDEFELELLGEPQGKTCKVTLLVRNVENGDLLESLSAQISVDALPGNVAVVQNPQKGPKGKAMGRFAFRDWRVGGDAFQATPDHCFGPILWTMYTLSDSRSPEGFILKLSALTGPLSRKEENQVELQTQVNGKWVSQGRASLDPDAWVATFRIPNWNEKASVPFRVLLHEPQRDGEIRVSEYTGTIRQNPSGRPLRMAALTCQKDYGFPYAPVAQNVLKLDPDLAYFSGDQLYEDHGGFGLIRDPAEPAILCYLRKFYMFGWAFRDVMRDRPTICLPDDHDVFHGNLWGEGGIAMGGDRNTSTNGGYREPARMVNVVHRTCVSHHPDPFDPAPCEQDISVYYGDLVYGDVGFAIVADRQFKSGPQHVDTGAGRPDHVPDPDFDTSTLDKPGLVLLGERQEEFLRQWVKDWRGHNLKVLLSQTVFAGVATHHGEYDGYLKADLDCGGWPQTARNRAISILREAMPLHINGDQHITSLTQYGVNKQRDSFWSFCSPAISAGYPRWWRPDELNMPHTNRPRHGLPNTGEYVDGLGNLVYVYAIGNPEVGTKKHRYELAHQKGSGFGLVEIDPKKKTYTINSFRFLIDVSSDDPGNQFPGWPVTIHQQENRGENLLET